MQTEDYCPGTTDFKVIGEKAGVFSEVEEEIEIIGFINCGAVPEKSSAESKRACKKGSADTIVFASCIQKGTRWVIPFPLQKAERYNLCRV